MMHNDDVPCTCDDCELHRFTEAGHKVITALVIGVIAFIIWLGCQ